MNELERSNKENSCQLLALIDPLSLQIYLGFEWMGWSNDSSFSRVPGRYIELIFQFDTVRNFSAVTLHTNNMFSKGVTVSIFYFNEIFKRGIF